jgi:hypothetical protein
MASSSLLDDPSRKAVRRLIVVPTTESQDWAAVTERLG